MHCASRPLRSYLCATSVLASTGGPMIIQEEPIDWCHWSTSEGGAVCGVGHVIDPGAGGASTLERAKNASTLGVCVCVAQLLFTCLLASCKQSGRECAPLVNHERGNERMTQSACNYSSSCCQEASRQAQATSQHLTLIRNSNLIAAANKRLVRARQGRRQSSALPIGR